LGRHCEAQGHDSAAQAPVEEPRHDVEIFLRFRQIDVGEEGMLQPIPDMELGIDAEA
jgi:hypothetical protein